MSNSFTETVKQSRSKGSDSNQCLGDLGLSKWSSILVFRSLPVSLDRQRDIQATAIDLFDASDAAKKATWHRNHEEDLKCMLCRDANFEDMVDAVGRGKMTAI